MSRYTVSPAARDELDAIWDYVGIQCVNPPAADRLIEVLGEKFALLATRPGIGERCHEFEHLVVGLRHAVVGDYIIYYVPMDDGIRVGHIAHGAMDQEALFRRWLAVGEFGT